MDGAVEGSGKRANVEKLALTEFDRLLQRLGPEYREPHHSLLLSGEQRTRNLRVLVHPYRTAGTYTVAGGLAGAAFGAVFPYWMGIVLSPLAALSGIDSRVVDPVQLQECLRQASVNLAVAAGTVYCLTGLAAAVWQDIELRRDYRVQQEVRND